MLSSLLSDQPGIEIFGFKIYVYALCIVSGMIAAFFLISLLFKRRNMSPDLFMTYFCVTLPIALVTTRVFYCITDPGMDISEWFSFASIRRGGLSIIGGILGGIFGVALVSIIKKVNFFRVGDCIVPGLLLAQAIGRWGNFANQEVFGKTVTNESLQWFPFAVFIEARNEWHVALFFYESLASLIGAALIFLFVWKNPKKPNGVATAWYFMHYGAVRSILEPMRDSQYTLNRGDVLWSLVFALLLFLCGAVMMAFVLLRNRKKEGVLFGSLKGDPYAITAYRGDLKNEIPIKSKINIMCAIYPENYADRVKDTSLRKQETPAKQKEEEASQPEQDDTAEEGK